MPAKLSEGALYLLEIARENDRLGALEKNAAFVKALELGQDMLQVCKKQGIEGLCSLLGGIPPPQNFLMITAAALHEIRRRAEEYLKGEVTTASAVRDFDRHALQGFAEALADLAWTNRKASDFDGPDASAVVESLKQTQLRMMWLYTIQHYMADIFQDNFAALRMREMVPELDPATEVDLRLVDARRLAEHAMWKFQEISDETDAPAFMALALYQAINETLEG
jgi:hypothetical protein